MSRVASLVYGSIAYTTFLGAFLYAAGFVGNVFVPKSINSGDAGPLGQALLINTVLLGVFAIQHTGMARKAFKRWLTRFVPESIERSTYVLCASLSLIVLYWQWQPLPEVIWNIESAGARAAVQALFAGGWLFVFLSTVMIHHFDLFGMRQTWLRFRNQPYRELGFRTPGFYKYVRHPIQVGFLIAFWATPTMTVGHLLFAAATTAYIVIAVKMFEEKDLLREHGERYRTYMDQVGGFIPKGRFRGSADVEEAV